MSEESELPDPRPDGRCAKCEKRPAVTNDKRFCKRCLGLLLDRLTPRVKSPPAEIRRPKDSEDDDEVPSDLDDWIHSIEENGSDD